TTPFSPDRVVYPTAGLKGVVWTDVLQFCILAPGFLLILPFVMGAVGGWGNMATSLSSTHTNFFGVGANQILVWLFAVGPGVTLATYTWTRILAAKDEATARKGMIGSLLVGIPWYCIPIILGMVAAVKFPGLEDSQQAIPMIITQMLHPVAGALLLTAFLAVLMSSSDSILIYGSTTFTRDLYQAYMNPKASEKQLVYIGRLVTALMGLFALGWALWMPVIMPIWTLGYAVLSGALFAPVWLGMLSRWATPDASFWSMLICAAIYSVGHFTKPWGLDPIFYVLPLSIILMYILSQYTPKTPREKMEKFLSGEAAGD
ncbi:MAG: sodium:solute symporter family protein, partial [Bacillota bacterium]